MTVITIRIIVRKQGRNRRNRMSSTNLRYLKLSVIYHLWEFFLIGVIH